MKGCPGGGFGLCGVPMNASAARAELEKRLSFPTHTGQVASFGVSDIAMVNGLALSVFHMIASFACQTWFRVMLRPPFVAAQTFAAAVGNSGQTSMTSSNGILGGETGNARVATMFTSVTV